MRQEERDIVIVFGRRKLDVKRKLSKNYEHYTTS